MNIKQFIQNIPGSATALRSISNSITNIGNRLYYKEKALCIHGKMNKSLIDNINEVVKPDDTLYMLGNLGKGSNWRAIQWRNLIDYKNFNVNSLKEVFQWVGDYKELTYNNKLYILFHYSIDDWNQKCVGQECFTDIHTEKEIIMDY